MMKTGGGERDVVSWLHHRGEEEFASDRISSFLSSEVFSQLESKFEALDTNVRLKLVYSFLSLRKKQLSDFSEAGFISNILQQAHSNNEDEWLKIISEILQEILPENAGKMRKKSEENNEKGENNEGKKEENGKSENENENEKNSNANSSSAGEIEGNKLVIKDKTFEETVKAVNECVSSLNHSISFLPLESKYLSKNLYQSNQQSDPLFNSHFKLKSKDFNLSFKPPIIQKKFHREDSKGRFNEDVTSPISTVSHTPPAPISRQSSRQEIQTSPMIPSSHFTPNSNNDDSKSGVGALRMSRGYTQEKKKMVVLDFSEVKELANKKTVNTKKIQEEAERERKKKEKIEESEKKKQERESLKKEKEILKAKKEEEKKAKQEEKEEKKKKRDKPEEGALNNNSEGEKKEGEGEPKTKKPKKEKKPKVPGEEGSTEGEEKKEKKNKEKKEKEPKTPKIPGEKPPKKKKEKDPNAEPKEPSAKKSKTSSLPPLNSPLSTSNPFPSPLFPPGESKSPFPSKPILAPRPTQMIPVKASVGAIPVKSASAMASVRNALTANLQNKINNGGTLPIKTSLVPVKAAPFVPIPVQSQINNALPTVTRPNGPPQPTTMDELFGGSTNQLTPENRKLIQDFLNGNRDNPSPSTGPLRQILINFDKRTDEEPGYITEQSIIFEINYENGTWRKLRRKKREPITPIFGAPVAKPGVPAKYVVPGGKLSAPQPKVSSVPQKISAPPQQILQTVPISTAPSFPAANVAPKIPPPALNPLAALADTAINPLPISASPVPDSNSKP
eukprot:TRINITY_DN2629_c0_g1_i3.p1 TRINITY_DN2629_c0_g1~~TRINITY_DN2629_c0_g1_i3.p1  ORF type:complete len:788 (+),score=365.51 TRINITY_DN2629_c0_g1_i3:108-2471(+)